MSQELEITIQAPLDKIFATAADLTKWPEFLPHWRFNRFLSKSASGGVVKMSCSPFGLGGIGITWLAEYRIDPQSRELRFLYKKQLHDTEGIAVLWSFQELPDDSVRVLVRHEPSDQRFGFAHRLAKLFASQWSLRSDAVKSLAGLKRKAEAETALHENRRPIIAGSALPGTRRKSGHNHRLPAPARKALRQGR